MPRRNHSGRAPFAGAGSRPAGSKPAPQKSERATQPARAPAEPRAPAQPRERGGNWLYGIHAVRAALANPERRPKRLLATPEAAAQIADLAAPPVETTDRATLDRLLPGAVHQGLALLADPLPDLGLDDIIDAADDSSLVLLLDQVTDPHNVGAILRSAAAFGATAVVVQDRNSPPLTGTLAKAASGAVELVSFVRVVNLSRALRDLKLAGFWCVGLDGAAPVELDRALQPGKLALVLGAEGDGMRRLTAEGCDVLARLPTAGPLASLNVSNAAAIALYAARRR